MPESPKNKQILTIPNLLSMFRILLIPLIFILPQFLADKVFAVWLAEPVADILAAATTGIMFARRFPKILKRREEELEK